MKRFRKILKFLGLGLLALLVVALGIFAWLVVRAWPKTKGSIAAAGLTAPVEVVRDHWGVPHLYAANEHDLFFAQGYVHAQDRLWQMEFNRHVSSGSLSALFGRPTVETDRFLRTFGMHRAAEEDWKVLAPETRQILEAYAAGVNAFLAQHRGKLPLELTVLGVEPAPWTPVDTLAWAKMIAFSLGQNHTQELMRSKLAKDLGPELAARLLPTNPASEAPIVAPEAGGYATAVRTAQTEMGRAILAAFLPTPSQARGSNNWVVHGSRTATGLPLLANDTHLDLAMPSVWYENGLHGGRFDVVGFSFAGVPLVLIGHNARIAWGISNMCGDSQDLFEETLNDRRQYRDHGAWKDLRVVRESIPVKGGKAETVEALWTARGPIVNEVEELPEGSPKLALRWTAHDPGHNLDALAKLDTATDWPTFRAALELWGAPTLNFVYADVDNNIGYQAAGKIPIRVAGQSGLVPVPAGDGDRDWTGFIPFDGMPKLFNPTAGFIVTANNKVVAESYPYNVGGDFADPYRAGRITEVLHGLTKASVDDMKSLQGDVYSPAAAGLRPYLLALQPEGAQEKVALAEVARWDLRFTPESPGAAIYYAWFNKLLPAIIGDELGEERMNKFRGFATNQTPMFTALMANPNDPLFDDKTTKDKVETRDDIVKRAFHEGVQLLANRLGGKPAEWRWGRLHTALLVHAPFGNSGIGPLMTLFNGKAVPLAGEAFTVNSITPAPRRPYLGIFGVSQRLIVDLKDMSRSPAVNSTGQSGLLFDKHREDQIPLWAAVQYRDMLFSKAAVEAGAEERLTLTPK